MRDKTAASECAASMTPYNIALHHKEFDQSEGMGKKMEKKKTFECTFSKHSFPYSMKIK